MSVYTDLGLIVSTEMWNQESGYERRTHHRFDCDRIANRVKEELDKRFRALLIFPLTYKRKLIVIGVKLPNAYIEYDAYGWQRVVVGDHVGMWEPTE